MPSSVILSSARLEVIRARHAEAAGLGTHELPLVVQADRGELLAEVDRLRAALFVAGNALDQAAEDLDSSAELLDENDAVGTSAAADAAEEAGNAAHAALGE